MTESCIPGFVSSSVDGPSILAGTAYSPKAVWIDGSIIDLLGHCSQIDTFITPGALLGMGAEKSSQKETKMATKKEIYERILAVNATLSFGQKMDLPNDFHDLVKEAREYLATYDPFGAVPAKIPKVE